MDEIIAKYEEHSEYSNVTSDRRRRMSSHNSVNEGSWDCSTTSSLIESFENITYQMEAFNELNCTDHEEHEEHSHHIPDGVYIVLYCGFVLFIGCLLKYLQHRFHVPIPYTVLLLITGTVLEVIGMSDDSLFGHLNYGFQQVRYVYTKYAKMRTNGYINE